MLWVRPATPRSGYISSQRAASPVAGGRSLVSSAVSVTGAAGSAGSQPSMYWLTSTSWSSLSASKSSSGGASCNQAGGSSDWPDCCMPDRVSPGAGTSVTVAASTQASVIAGAATTAGAATGCAAGRCVSESGLAWLTPVDFPDTGSGSGYGW